MCDLTRELVKPYYRVGSCCKHKFVAVEVKVFRFTSCLQILFLCFRFDTQQIFVSVRVCVCVYGVCVHTEATLWNFLCDYCC